MIWLPLLLAGGIFSFVLVLLVGRTLNRQLQRIHGATGVEQAGYMTLGGIEQHVRIRGQNRSNPVIVILHGGPGNPMVGDFYRWERILETDYTLVYWDQRGCGNTYYRKKSAEKPTVNLLLSDLDELLDQLRDDYGAEKVILVGHSWGTLLGGIYALRHPEKVFAYVSMSQMLDFKESERASAQEAIRRANARGKTQDVTAMEQGLVQLMSLQKLDKSAATALIRFRQKKERYLPPQYGQQGLLVRLLCPNMTWSNVKWMLNFPQLMESNEHLYEALVTEPGLSMYDFGLRYEVPVIMIAGEWDWTTPHAMAQHYFQTLSAPYKAFFTIEGAGHLPFAEKPKVCGDILLKSLAAALER